jgi:hypothetical protein
MANDNRIQAKESVVEKEAVLDLKEGAKKLEPEIQAAQQTPEQMADQESGEQGEQAEVSPVVEQTPVSTPISVGVGKEERVEAKDRLSEEIDDVLEEDLGDLYKAMSPDEQRKFKEKGEETVSKIRELVRATKINAKKIFKLIREWLKLIPGVNRFFLEQEAKIKTDKILIISEEERKRDQNEPM